MHPGFPFRPIVFTTATLLGLVPGPAQADDAAGLGPFLEAVRDAFRAANATTGGPGLVWSSLADTAIQAAPPRDDASPPRTPSVQEAAPPRLVPLPPPSQTPSPPPAAMARLARINGLTVETLPDDVAAFGYAAPAGDTPGDVLTGARFAATVQTGGLTWEVARNLSPAEDFGLIRRNRETLAAFSDPAAFRSPWLAWTGEGQSVALTASAPRDGGLRIIGFSSTAAPEMPRPSLDVLAAEWTQPLGDGLRLGVQAGRLRDGEDVIASRRDGFALADPAPTRFAGLSMDASLAGGFVVAGSLHSGWTTPHPAGDASLASVSTLRSDSATLAVIGHGLVAGKDHFGLAARQPLRVDAGTGRLKATGKEVSLAAEGREVDVQAFYGVPTGEDSRLDANVTLRREPGHDLHAETETTGSLRWRMVF